MLKRKDVIKALECCKDINKLNCDDCAYTYNARSDRCECTAEMAFDALELLKEQEQRRRLEVHNIGNVDIPDGVTMEQFYAIMDNVVQALEHADKGESWPYAEAQRDYEAASDMRDYCERYEPTYNPDDGSM